MRAIGPSLPADSTCALHSWLLRPDELPTRGVLCMADQQVTSKGVKTSMKIPQHGRDVQRISCIRHCNLADKHPGLHRSNFHITLCSKTNIACYAGSCRSLSIMLCSCCARRKTSRECNKSVVYAEKITGFVERLPHASTIFRPGMPFNLNPHEVLFYRIKDL